MKTLPLNKNSNWYKVRFTEMTFIYESKIVVLYNYFTQQQFVIDDKKIYEKLKSYMCWFDNLKKGFNINFSRTHWTWTSQREKNKYDNDIVQYK